MIEPFFFGNGGELFGCYHPPSQLDSRRLAVICPPLFDEYKRCYKGLADLANGLADQGIHVLRFDYYGTGESWGVLEDASISRWIEDVRTAVEEGMGLSGADEVVLVGVRFGGAVAAQIKLPKVIRYVLWDPIIHGAIYLQELKAADEALEAESREVAEYVNQIPDEVDYEYFRLPGALVNDIRALNLEKFFDSVQEKKYFLTTNCELASKGSSIIPWEFAGIEYLWSGYFEGVLNLKPALEAIAQRVVTP